MQPTQSFRVVSVEPTGLVVPDISNIATNHNFELEVSEPSNFSTPFCGHQYFTQEFRLIRTDGDSTQAEDPLACLNEIQQILDAELADGYLELGQ